MHLGGSFDLDGQHFSARLVSALTEVRQFGSDCWIPSCWNHWVIDMVHADQHHRIGDGKAFVREAGSAVIYCPKLRYWEWQRAGHSQYESVDHFHSWRAVGTDVSIAGRSCAVTATSAIPTKW
jgi:hypothetical protein